MVTHKQAAGGSVCIIVSYHSHERASTAIAAWLEEAAAALGKRYNVIEGSEYASSTKRCMYTTHTHTHTHKQVDQSIEDPRSLEDKRRRGEEEEEERVEVGCALWQRFVQNLLCCVWIVLSLLLSPLSSSSSSHQRVLLGLVCAAATTTPTFL